MTGSEKQIKWANEIKEEITKQAETPLQRAAGRTDKKAIEFVNCVNFILAIDSASFWIDYRDRDFQSLIGSLMAEGLRTKGLDFAALAKFDKATGKITEEK